MKRTSLLSAQYASEGMAFLDEDLSNQHQYRLKQFKQDLLNSRHFLQIYLLF